jgi:RHS repeat-associated protein
LQLSYTPLGQISSVALANRGTMGYTYDRAGRTSRLTYPDGTTVDRSYQSDGQLQQVQRTGVVQASYRYDSVGRMDQATLGNGTVRTQQFDMLDRVRTMETLQGATLVARFTNTYQPSGLLATSTERVAPATTDRVLTWGYDGVRRLVRQQASGSSTDTYQYSYDLAGNRTQAQQTVNGVTTTQTRSYNERNQVDGWQYDDAGNLLNDGQYRYEYTVFGQLRASIRQQGEVRSEYRYTSDGQLTDVTQVNTNVTTRYIPDYTTGLPTMLSDGTTNIVYGVGSERLQAVTAGTATWFTHDHLGSTRQTVTNSGTVAGSARYDPWGAPLENTTGSRFGFTGELTDNGLVYLRARWYNPSTGTFTSRDPFPGVDTVPQSLHPYAYTHNNPVNATDPSGKDPWWGDERRCDPLTEIYDIVQKRCMPRARKPGFEPALPTPNGSSLKERANAATERALRGETATASLSEGALRQPGRDTKGLGVGLGIGIAALCALLLTGQGVNVIPSNPPQVPTPEREEEVTVYRGVNATNPGAFRVDSDGVSVFEVVPPGYKFSVPFRLRYKSPKNTGTVGILLAPELTGGTATYTPHLGGPGHWSLNFPGKTADEIKRLLADFAKKSQ